ncbi:hypothetical protein ABTA59_19545, partial [Acinetobacter baumannii]
MNFPLKPDVSVVVPFHHEGLLAHQTLLSIEQMRHYAKQHSISSELVIVFDQADRETQRVVTHHPAFHHQALSLH